MGKCMHTLQAMPMYNACKPTVTPPLSLRSLEGVYAKKHARAPHLNNSRILWDEALNPEVYWERTRFTLPPSLA